MRPGQRIKLRVTMQKVRAGNLTRTYRVRVPRVKPGRRTIRLIGFREASPDEQLLYPVSELAARYGASAKEETPDPEVAYAGFGGVQPGRPPYWDAFPWA